MRSCRNFYWNNRISHSWKNAICVEIRTYVVWNRIWHSCKTAICVAIQNFSTPHRPGSEEVFMTPNLTGKPQFVGKVGLLCGDWIFEAIVRPILTYGAAFSWITLSSKENCRKIEGVQRAFVISILGALRTTPIIDILRILAIPLIYLYANHLFMLPSLGPSNKHLKKH